MIVFLNFAPISYMGGAEKRILELATKLGVHEKTRIICTSHTLSNGYARLVLGTTFHKRVALHGDDASKILEITIGHIIPFTRKWSSVIHLIKESRRIYIKFEINELFLLLYFGGLGAYKKSIAGIRSPIRYHYPISLFDRLHNLIYNALFLKFVLSKFSAVHVLNKRDKAYFEQTLHVQSVTYLPNWIIPSTAPVQRQKTDRNNLHVIFAGELIMRKGIDIVMQVIKKSPKEYIFHIAGNGEYEKEIEQLSENYENCTYYGFLGAGALHTLYRSCDVLFVPSRAETFGNIFIEAMGHGLIVINSDAVGLDSPKEFEYSPILDVGAYMKILNMIFLDKCRGKIDREKIVKYVYSKYSEENILPVLKKKLFDMK